MKTFLPNAAQIKESEKWHLIDAEGITLGRLATRVADLLRGKHKATFTRHMVMGDFVIITNAQKIAVTGKKLTDKEYIRHTEFPGGIKRESLEKLLARKPEEVIRIAVKGMLPKCSQSRTLMTRLKIYAGSEHPHGAQQPVAATIPHFKKRD